ncbi:MAG TPA: hypothetical protein VGK73_11885 [Polyangiaceae bacterium]
MTRLIGGTFAASLLLGSGCGSAPRETEFGRETSALSERLVVYPAVRHQHITGFGASSAWTARSLTDDVADLLFSPDGGIGLSLLRLRIAPDTSTELSTALSAHARGAAVWAAPWSPPGNWKTSGTDNYGGALLPEYYQAWADRLSGFAAGMAAAGVPLFALSAQNEPNWVAEWETCEYTPAELKTFIRDYLGPALRRDSPGTLLVAPESIDWNTIGAYADPLLADPVAKAEIGVVAVHSYGGAPYAYPSPAQHDKEFWETEVSYDKNTGLDATLETAREIHRHLTVANVNAFHYWWLVSDSGGGLLENGVLTPQAYGLGHFSKFIRPGFERVELVATPEGGIYTSAYVEPASGRVVIVALNETGSSTTASFQIAGFSAGRAEPWVTNAEVELEPRAAIDFGETLDYILSARSVTTLVLSTLVAPSAGGGGEGGETQAAAGAGGEDPGMTGSAGASGGESGASDSGGQAGQVEPDPAGSGGSPPAGRGGSSGRADSGGESGASEHGGGPGAPVAPQRPRAQYMTCSMSSGGGVPSGTGALPLAVLAALACRRRRHARASFSRV